MKKLAIFAAMIAMTAASAANAAQPQGNFGGGPVKQGNYCWVNTTMTGAGWWDKCDGNTPVSQRGIKDPGAAAGMAGGGGGGGGGGGK